MVTKKILVEESQTECVHFLAQQKKYIIILKENNSDYDTVIVQEDGDEIILIEKGIIVSTSH